MLEIVDRVQITHKNVPLDLVASHEGLRLLEGNPNVLDLFVNIPANGIWDFFTGKVRLGSRGFVTVENLASEPKKVAVKSLYLGPSVLNGQEEFLILEGFKSLGFGCVNLLASEKRILSKWVDGPVPRIQRWHLENQFGPFLSKLCEAAEILKEEKIVPDKDWEIDGDESNYRQSVNYDLLDPKTWFIPIDPIMIRRDTDQTLTFRWG